MIGIRYSVVGGRWSVAFASCILLMLSIACSPQTGSLADLTVPSPTPLPTAEPTPVPTATIVVEPTEPPATAIPPTVEPTPSPFENHDAISKKDAQLREGAGPNHLSIGQLTKDTPLNLQARNGDWFLVDTDTLLSGWLPLSAIEFRPGYDPASLPFLSSSPPLSELLLTYPVVTYQQTDLFTGPSLAYGVYGNGIPPNSPLNVTGRDSLGLMLQVEDNFGPPSWVLASSLRFNPTFNIFDLPITAENEFEADSKFVYDWSTLVYEYGGQTHDMRHTQQMSEIGMNWVKVQYKFHEFSQPRDIIGLVEQAHERGFKLLIATTGQPYPAEIDFEGYVEFIAGVAIKSLNPRSCACSTNPMMSRGWLNS